MIYACGRIALWLRDLLVICSQKYHVQPNTQFQNFRRSEHVTFPMKLSVLLRLWCIQDARIDPSRHPSTDEPDTTKSCRRKASSITKTV